MGTGGTRGGGGGGGCFGVLGLVGFKVWGLSFRSGGWLGVSLCISLLARCVKFMP